MYREFFINFCFGRLTYGGLFAVQQIELAQEEVIKTKQKYEAATDHLKELLDKKKSLQTEELMTAVMKSKRSFEDILHYINSEPEVL